METDSLLLSCHARITPPVYVQPWPIISWWKNGTLLTEESAVIRSNYSSGVSELAIYKTDVNSSGYYQCMASDAAGRYITLSRKAFVTVLAKGNVLVLCIFCVCCILFFLVF